MKRMSDEAMDGIISDDPPQLYGLPPVTTPKPPLRLTGTDGNAFAILGAASRVLRRAGRADEVAEYQRQATAGDYDNLLAVTCEWFEVS